MKIGILTGGGDCAGINSSIRGATLAAEELNHELFGIKHGWKGLIDYEELPLNSKIVDGIGEKAGTILGTSRTNPFKDEGGKDRSNIVLENLKIHKYDALISIGGEDTLGVACNVDQLGFPVVGIPKTMDYDLQTYSLGFDTAVENVRDYLVRLPTTASSHERVFVVEVFGRNTGHVAFQAGIAGMADIILIPEIPYDINIVCNAVNKAYEQRKKNGLNPYAIVAAAEGAVPIEKDEKIYVSEKKDEFGHKKLGGISEKIASQIERKLGYETRPVVFNYISRSGGSGCFDSFMGERLGRGSIYAVQEGKHGVAVVDIDGDVIKVMPIKDLIEPKRVDVKEVSIYEKSISFGRPSEKYNPKIEVINLNRKSK